MQINVENQSKSTIKMTVVIPNDKVKETYNQVVDALVDTAEISGFRKGKAPKDKVLEKTDPAKLNGEVVNKLLETY